MVRLGVIKAKLIVANRELKGSRTVLFRLVAAALSLPLSLLGIVLALAGFNTAAQVLTLITIALLSSALGLSALKSLKTVAPILQRGR